MSVGIGFTLLLILSIAMMAVDYRQQRLAQLRIALSTLVAPMLYVVDLPFDLLRLGAKHFQSRQALLQENTDLKQNQLLLSLRLQRVYALETENKRLRLLLDSEPVTHEKRVLIAEILKVELDPFSHRVTINKGEHHGVHVGQPIMDAYGVMGQIIEVGMFDSVVLLITDMNHAIPVQSNRSGARAVANGSGSYHELVLNHVTTTADIKVGDLLVSSGLGGNFPQGYPVGMVESVSSAPGETFAKVIARPSAQLDRTREVLLLWTDEHAS
jgi:rod shape-determining protein MreC